MRGIRKVHQLNRDMSFRPQTYNSILHAACLGNVTVSCYGGSEKFGLYERFQERSVVHMVSLGVGSYGFLAAPRLRKVELTKNVELE